MDSTDSTLRFVGRFVRDGLREISPMHNIRRLGSNVRRDILAGITVAVIALPLALAFGVGSGLGAITGLWGAICGGLVGGLFGGSSVGVSGPTGPKMVQLAAVMEDHRLLDGSPDLGFAFGIVLVSGVILIALGLLRLGRFVYYTPYSVVAGFMCGIGVIVVLLEVDPFLGLPAPSSVIEAIYELPKAVTHAHPDALLVSVPTLASIFMWDRWRPIRWLPSPLIALVVGTGLAVGLNLQVETIGEIPTGLPDIYLPELSAIPDMLLPALALAGLAVFDSLLTCLVTDHMFGERHSSDRECFGQGLANLAAGLVGGLTTATATMRSVANIQSGARTPLAAMVHGMVLLALVLGLGPLAERIPMAWLAAILFKVGLDIIDYRILPVLHRLPISDAITFWGVLIVTVWVDLLVAMGIGMAFAFFRFVQEMTALQEHRAARLSEELDVEGADRIALLQPDGPLFFGSAIPLQRAYEAHGPHDVLLIDLRKVTMIDLSGAYAVEDVIETARKHGAHIIVAGARPPVEHVFRRLRLVEKFGDGGYVDGFDEACRRAQALVERSVEMRRSSASHARLTALVD